MNLTDKNLSEAYESCSGPERAAIFAMLRGGPWLDIEALRRALRKIRARLKRKAREGKT